MEEFNRILRMSGIYRRRLYIKTWRAVRNIYSKYKRVVDRVFICLELQRGQVI